MIHFNHVHLHVGHHVHLHVGHHVGHHNVISTLCEGSETLTEWKSERMTDVDGVGVKEAFASKNKIIHKRKAIVMKIEHFELNLFLQDSEKNIDIGSTQADP